MKKALLGTTALVAGGFLAGPALAADIIPAPIPEPVEEGFTLTVSGDAVAAFSFRSTDECDVDPDGFNSDTAANILAAAANAGVGAGATALAGNKARACSLNDPDDFSADANGFIRHDDEATHVQWSSEIRFTAEQTLANGLTITARVELEGQQSNDQIDEHWISFAGHFGEIKIGAEDSALDQLGVGVPGFAVIGTTDGPSANVLVETNTQTGANKGPSGDANKIVYFTPRFSGLQIGVSWAPSFGPNGSQSDGRNHVLDSEQSYQSEASIAANYRATYGDHTWVIGGGYTFADAESQIDTFAECQANAANPGTTAAAFGQLTGDFRCGDLEVWHIGTQFGNSYYTIGGWYTDSQTDFGKTEITWSVGGVINSGDWEYGLAYGNYEDQHALGGFTDEREQWVAGIGNTLAPGVTVGAFLFYAQEDAAYRSALNAIPAGPVNINSSVDGWAAGLATGLAF